MAGNLKYQNSTRKQRQRQIKIYNDPSTFLAKRHLQKKSGIAALLTKRPWPSPISADLQRVM